jgi:hypothetical protein
MIDIVLAILLILLVGLIVMTIFQIAFTRSITKKIKMVAPYNVGECPIPNVYVHTLMINNDLSREFNSKTTSNSLKDNYNSLPINTSKTVYHPFHYSQNGSTSVIQNMKTELYNPIHIIVSGNTALVDGLYNNDYTYALYGNNMCYVHFNRDWNFNNNDKFDYDNTKQTERFYVLSLYNINIFNSDSQETPILNYTIRDRTMISTGTYSPVRHVPFTSPNDAENVNMTLSINDIIGSSNNTVAKNTICHMCFIK